MNVTPWIRRIMTAPIRVARLRSSRIFGMAIGLLIMLTPLSAQTGAPAGDRESAQVVAMTTSAAVDVAQEGLPLDMLAQRSQRAYRHVFLAFGIAWLLILLYALILDKRLGELERRINRD